MMGLEPGTGRESGRGPGRSDFDRTGAMAAGDARTGRRGGAAAGLLALATGAAAGQPGAALDRPAAADQPAALRIATFNIEDVRTAEVLDPASPRLRRAAEIIQRIRPGVLLVNELTYDQPGDPGYVAGAVEGQNAARFVENFLRHAQATDVQGLSLVPFTARTNTGVPSGFDLDRSGSVSAVVPPEPPVRGDGSPGPQTAEQRAYGGDCWGFGTYPGQYGMALFVDARFEVLTESVRTFRLFPWQYMPNHLMPPRPEGAPEAAPPLDAEGREVAPKPSVDADAPVADIDAGAIAADPADGNGATGADGAAAALPAVPPEPAMWYEGEAGTWFRLSSKSHWDVPVRLPNGAIVHFLCSHPTPPAFDGEEQRNKRRNHDEIRFWADYINNAAYIVDDKEVVGGLPRGAHFVILGDLNADPDEGSGLHDPMGSLLLSSRLVNSTVTPVSDVAVEGLDADDTAMFGLRVDYVLPSATMTARRGGVYRHAPAGGGAFPSDHFPVWLDVSVPAPPAR